MGEILYNEIVECQRWIKHFWKQPEKRERLSLTKQLYMEADFSIERVKAK